MRELDTTSLLVAALIGGVVLFLVNLKWRFFDSSFAAFVTGIIVGGSVQIGVRATGVS